ncbi:MAG: SulP family inorganic anion transporter [Candidatus Sericytochromatia bacterium]|nr:SulP family inorganic anion transporter [Candidatus Sericytochromatia bacterium]MEB3221350.1 SulP family inorganic anion transporter [Candidatus Sericytochromatia bacterium]
MPNSQPPPAPARETLPRDLMASLVVFLVALPLCMGVAIASGVPPAAGLLTGIIGGIVVGLFAGSPLQVSGPAAGLTVLVFELVQRHGLPMLGVIVLAAGVVQVAAGTLRLGRWFSAISPAVVHGMLAGIGALIIAAQVHVMVDDAPRGSGLANLLALPEALWKGVAPLDGTTHHIAAAVGLATIAVMLAWSYVPGPLRAIPPALVGVASATAAAAWLHLPIRYVDLPDSLLGSLKLVGLADLARLAEGPIFEAVLAVAVIASAESLLTAAAVDKMHGGPRHDPDRELMAQGLGNALCGIVGALPMTGVIVRSAANVQAGAVTRASTIFHGTWILATVALLPWLLERVPLTALAALLVYTGFKLLAPATLIQLLKAGRSEAGIYLLTAGAIVATNLLKDIIIGIIAALVRQLSVLSHLDIAVEHRPEANSVRLKLRGAATFLALPDLQKALAKVPAGADVVIDGGDLRHIDHACLEFFGGWEQGHAPTGGTVELDWDGLRGLQASSRPSTARAAVGAGHGGSGPLGV